MIAFWLLAALMTALAMGIVLVPLLRHRTALAPSVAQANLDVLRGQFRELDADVANGTLPAAAREAAVADLIARAGNDLVPETSAPAVPARKPWIAIAAAAVLVPALTFGVYLALGNPAATDPAKVIAREAGHPNAEQIAAMVDNLASKVRERPDDVRGWTLLARSMAALGRFTEAVDAYDHLLKLAPDDPNVMADYADALGMAQGRTLGGRPYELVKKALALDPRHHKALALAGTAAMDAGDLAGASGYWQTLAAEFPDGSDEQGQVRAVLEELRARAAARGTPLPAAPAASAPAVKVVAPPMPASGAALQKTVAGSVSIAPAIAAKVQPADTLFVFARASVGPRVPLAVLRATAGQLPLQFTLDDSLSMAPNAKLSMAEAVMIEARISRSGNALPQPGDLVGKSQVVKPGARDVRIVVDQVVP